MRNWFLFCGIAFAMVSCMVLGAGEAFAQTVPDVTFTPIVSFTALFATILGVLGPIVVGLIGVGISVWAAGYCSRMFRMLAREGGESRMCGNSIQSHSQSQRSYMSPRQRRRRRNKRR